MRGVLLFVGGYLRPSAMDAHRYGGSLSIGWNRQRRFRRLPRMGTRISPHRIRSRPLERRITPSANPTYAGGTPDHHLTGALSEEGIAEGSPVVLLG